MSSEEPEIVSKKQRISLRKVHRSHSPRISRSSHREIRKISDHIYRNQNNMSPSSLREEKKMYGVRCRPSSDDRRNGHLGSPKRKRSRVRYCSERESHFGQGYKNRGLPNVNKSHCYIGPYQYSLHVANFNPNMTDSTVQDKLFSRFKIFGHLKIYLRGVSYHRHAYINYTSKENATRALKEMHNCYLLGRSLKVSWTRQKYKSNAETVTDVHPSHSVHKTHTPPCTNRSATVNHSHATRVLFVGHLPYEVTQQELKDLFHPLGKVESIDVINIQKASITNAYVKFFSITDAIFAKSHTNKRWYRGDTLQVHFSNRNPHAKVRISNLSGYEDMAKICSVLDNFGFIQNVDHNTGNDYGFVHFDSMNDAQTAVDTLSTFSLEKTNLSLQIEPCQTMECNSAAENVDDDDADDQSLELPQEVANYRQLCFSPSPDRDFFSVNTSVKMEEVEISESEEYLKHVSHTESVLRQVESSLKDPCQYDGKDRDFVEIGKSPSHIREARHDYFSYFDSTDGIGRARMFGEKSQSESGSTYHYNKEHEDSSLFHNMSCEQDSDRSSNWDTEYHSERGERRAQEQGSVIMGGYYHGLSLCDKQTHTVSAAHETNQEVEMSASNCPTADMSYYIGADADVELNVCTHCTTSGDGLDESGVKPSLKMDNLADLARMNPIIWHGNLLLKHTLFPTQIHLIGGDVSMADGIVEAKGHREDMNVLHFTHRLHLDPPQLKDLNERMASGARHCIFLAVPAAIPDSQSFNSSTSLQPLKRLISYLDEKHGAGVVVLNSADGRGKRRGSLKKSVRDILYAFTPGEFSQKLLLMFAPNLGEKFAKVDHMVVLLIKRTV